MKAYLSLARLAGFFVPAILLAGIGSLRAGEPWLEPTRTSQLTESQKKWIDERKKVNERIDKLQAADFASAEAIRLAQKVVDRSAEEFGDKHDEMARALDKAARQAFFAQQFKSSVGLRKNVIDVYTAAYGKDNWRVTSATLEAMIFKVLAAEGADEARRFYSDAWGQYEPGQDLYEQSRFADALTRFEKAAVLFEKTWSSAGLKPALNVPRAKAIWQRGRCLTDLGRYREAEEALREALEGVRGVYDRDHPVFADVQYDLGRLHVLKGEYGQAEFAMREALATLEKAFGYAQRDQAEILCELGDLYLERFNPSLAETTYRRALKVFKESDEPYPLTYAKCLAGLTRVCLMPKRLDEAEAFAREALEYTRERLGATSMAHGVAANNMGHVLVERKKYEEALKSYETAHEILAKALGAQSWNAAVAATGIGLTYRALGRDDDAEKVLAGALAVLRRKLGDRHPQSRLTFSAYAGIFHDAAAKHLATGNVKELVAVRRKRSEVVTDFNGPKSWASVYYRLSFEQAEAVARQPEAEQKTILDALRAPSEAMNLFVAGKRDEGLALALKALETCRKHFPAGSLAVTESAELVARMQYTLGRAAEAEPLSIEVVAGFRKLWAGSDLPPGCAGALLRLGEYQRARRDFPGAIRLLDEAADVNRRTLGSGSASYAEARHAAAAVRLQSGDPGAAEPILREVIDVRTRLFGATSEVCTLAKEELLNALLQGNKIEETEQLLTIMLDETKLSDGPPSRRHVKYRHFLGITALQAGRPGNAVRSLSRTLDEYGKAYSTDWFYNWITIGLPIHFPLEPAIRGG